MADRKITDLTALAAGSQATGDLLTIVDVSESAAADKNKKITMENLFKGIPGQLLAGTSSAPAGTDAQYARFAVRGNTLNTNSAYLSLGNNKTTAGTTSDDNLGIITFNDNDSDAGEYARITGATDGANGTDDYPGKLVFSTTADGASSPTERMRIASDGLTTVTGGVQVTGDTTPTSGKGVEIFRVSDTLSQIQTYNRDASAWMNLIIKGNTQQFYANGSEAMRIDSSGRLLIGATSSVAFNGVPSAVQIEGSTDATTRLSIRRTANDSSAGVLVFGKSRSSAHAVLSSGDEIGKIEFYGADGSDTNQRAAIISAEVDGTPGSNDMPGRLVFSTTADGASTPTERMRIDSSGRLCLGTTSSSVLSTFALNSTNAYSATGNINNSNVGLKLYNSNGSDGTGVNNYAGIQLNVGSGAASSGSLAYVRTADNQGAFVFNQRTGASSYAEAMRIDSSGRLLAGTTVATNAASYADNLVIGTTSGDNGMTIVSGTSDAGSVNFSDGTGTNSTKGIIQYSHNANALYFYTDGSEQVRIDSSGRLLVGTSSSTQSSAAVFQANSGSSTSYGTIKLARGSTPSDGFRIGSLEFTDNGHQSAAAVDAEQDGGTWTSGSSHPTRLLFRTSADGASSPTERVRINRLGHVNIGSTADNTDKRLFVVGATNDSSQYATTIRNSVGANLMYIRNDAHFFCDSIYNQTTAAGANVHIDGAARLLRVTSSLKYKTNVETLEDSYADAILNVRPIWYQSLGANDNPNWGWWGFIAEEVAEIDPRLVSWKTTEVVEDENGEPSERPLETPEPEGVHYERFVPHLLNLIKRQQQAISTLETKVAALEAQ